MERTQEPRRRTGTVDQATGDAPGPTLTRRGFIGAGLLIAVTISGADALLTPAEAHAQSADLRVLTPREATTLGAWTDQLVPGAREAGVVEYVDAQLAAPPEAALLFMRYLDQPPPYAPFYRRGIASLDAAAERRGGRFADLSPDDQGALVGEIADPSTEAPAGWDGPPAPLFAFVTRGDGLDVTYGTPEGFDRIGFPGLFQVEPPTDWVRELP